MTNLKKETIYLYVIQISNFAIPLITLPYLTKVLQLEGLGKLGLAQSIFTFMGFVIDFGFSYSASRIVSLNKGLHELNKIYTNVQAIRWMIFGFLSIVSILIIYLINLTESEKNIYMVAVLSSISFVLIPSWLFNGLSKNSILSFFTLVFRVLTLIPIFMIVTNKEDYLYAFFIQNTSLVVLGLIVSIYIKYKENIKYSLKMLDLKVLKDFFIDGFNVFSGSALSVIYTTGVPILIRIVLNEYWVGVFILVERIMSVLKQMYMPIMQAYYAKICQLYGSNNKVEIKLITRRIILFYSSLSFLALIVHILIGRWVIDIFFNAQQILFHYIIFSIIGQFVVGLSIVYIYGNILANGSGYILRRIYSKAALLFLILVIVLNRILNLDLIYGIVILTELYVVFSAIRFIKENE